MSGGSSIFIDSNIWIYALSTEDDEKARHSRQLVNDLGSKISFTTQIINEVCINLKRKSSISERDIRTLIESFYLNYQAIEIKETVLVFASDCVNVTHSLFGIASWRQALWQAELRYYILKICRMVSSLINNLE